MDLLLEITNTPVIEALLLLLLLPGEGMGKIDWSNNLIKGYKEQYLKLKHKSEADDFISFVLKNDFRKDLLEDKNLTYLFIQLDKVKKKLLETYFISIKENSDLVKGYEYVGDFNSLISKYYIQLKRLQLTIQPDIQLSKSKHPKTDIEYLKSIGYWINGNGERERKFFKSVGRLDEYPKGKDDKNAFRLAEEMIRELVLKEYKETYPE